VFFYHLGRARLEQGRTDDARDAFETALSLQSDFKGAESARKILADL
jgi:cytochrome c-type biogenesis protein CcmH/NrfG